MVLLMSRLCLYPILWGKFVVDGVISCSGIHFMTCFWSKTSSSSPWAIFNSFASGYFASLVVMPSGWDGGCYLRGGAVRGECSECGW